MKTIHLNADNLDYWKEFSEPSAMALGFFDGIHSGHAKVIRTAGKIAKTKNLAHTVMSFFPHPKTVLGKEDKRFDYLMPLSKKASILESLGVDTFYIVEFNKEFLSLGPEQFISNYLLNMQVEHAVAGFDFTYGHRGAGTIDRLTEDSENKIGVTKIEEVAYEGKTISSTWTRELINEGKVKELVDVLGRYYETEVTWDGTCLKASPYFMLPAPGVYETAIRINGKLQTMELLVGKEREAVYLTGNPPYRFTLNEKMEIMWLAYLAANTAPGTVKSELTIREVR